MYVFLILLYIREYSAVNTWGIFGPIFKRRSDYGFVVSQEYFTNVRFKNINGISAVLMCYVTKLVVLTRDFKPGKSSRECFGADILIASRYCYRVEFPSYPGDDAYKTAEMLDMSRTFTKVGRIIPHIILPCHC